MNKRLVPWFCFLLSVLGGCCAPLPEVEPGPQISWPAPFEQRDLFQGPGVSLLASSPKDAAKGLKRYLQMLEDLGMTAAEMEQPGVLVILGEDDALLDDELQAFFEVLGTEPEPHANAVSRWDLAPELMSQLDPEVLQALEQEQAEFEPSAWSEFLANADSKDPRDVFCMAAFPLEISKLKACLDWQPREEPTWALSLGTGSRVGSAMLRVMDVELKEQGAGLFERNLLPLGLGLVLPNLRRQTCTRILVEVAFPQLSDEERKALFSRL